MATHLAARRTAIAQTILAALAQCGGNRSHAAEVAGYADASSMRRAARRAGLDLDAVSPALTPEEYGGLRRETPKKKASRKKVSNRAKGGGL